MQAAIEETNPSNLLLLAGYLLLHRDGGRMSPRNAGELTRIPAYTTLHHRRISVAYSILGMHIVAPTASVVTWLEFLGSISGAAKFLSSWSGTGSSQPHEYN
jgi:hypothetical protein